MLYNINLNTAQCIKETSNFGSNIYYNICDGSNHLVPWGTLDWVMPILGITLIGTAILAFAGLVVAEYQIMYKD